MRNVHAYIVGEHGDTELPVWSHATIGVQKLETILANNEQYKQEDLDKIFENVRDALTISSSVKVQLTTESVCHYFV